MSGMAEQAIQNLDPRRDTPTHPMTRLQSRIQDEVQMHHEVLAKHRDSGGPEMMGEIDRELTMATGALEGVYQRLGGLAAKLAPVMPGDTLLNMTAGPGRALQDSFEVNSEVGRRIHEVTAAISEIEDALGTLVNSVRL